ncbi:MAG: hypothetical protein ABIP48_30590, partial [Planctomycetota bacterium]
MIDEMMKLRFDEKQIAAIAAKYAYQREDEEVTRLKRDVAARGFLTKDDLQKVAYWKAPRSVHHIEKNCEEYIKEVTGFALRTTSERARIQALTVLDGVSWPTASVILHFFHEEKSPILDFRALWSLMVELPNQYTFSLWWPYVQFCRELSRRNRVDMRTLDRALWQYS